MDKKAKKLQFIAHYRQCDRQAQSLREHLQKTSELSAQNAAKIGLGMQGKVVGVVHDIGKATELFYNYICSATGLFDPDAEDYLNVEENTGKIDHSSAGAQFICRYVNKLDPQAQLVSQVLAIIVASHHSGIMDCITPDGYDKYTARIQKPDDLTRLIEAEANLDEDIKNEIISILEGDRFVPDTIAKIKSIKEENDSKETFYFKLGLLVRFLFSCLIDADRTDTAEFEYPYEKNIRENQKTKAKLWPILVERLEQHLNTINPLNKIDYIRQNISDRCGDFADKGNGIFQLTVPTGGGKTLSSLRFALKHAQINEMDRIIYVIPFTSIIDQNAEKVREILEPSDERNQIVLEHHSNLTPEKEGVIQKILSQNWDAPVVFTTMVQFLETIFGGGTRSARKMHQLANSVIVFDEIQTLPIRCIHMFNVAIRFLVNSCNSTVLLCTATQPLLDEVPHSGGEKGEENVSRFFLLPIPKDKKIIEDVSGLFTELKRVEIFNQTKVGGWTEEKIVELAQRELRVTGSVLIVVNTKNAARNIYKQLAKLYTFSSDILFHLSTSMCPEHRMSVLTKIKERLNPDNNQPVICVSTQLIEAGVDVDCSVIRFLAGLDSIAQAAGRCNRNGSRPALGRVHIINPDHEDLEKLPDIKYGIEKTRQVLYEFDENPDRFDKNLIGDKAIKHYYKYYFHQRRHEMNYPVSSKSTIGRDDNLFNLLSSNNLSVEAYKRQSQSALKTHLVQSFTSAAKQFHAIESYTQGVIVPYGKGTEIIIELCSDPDLPKFYQELKKAQRFSVNLFTHEFDNLSRQNAIRETKEGSGVFYLDERFYSKQFGLSLSVVEEMELLNP